jgi:hypothetical protein
LGSLPDLDTKSQDNQANQAQFPIGQDESGDWRLDIAALLAVTGESFIGEHAQALTSSMLCLLPRIMPAPHALLQPRRPASLPAE